MNEADKNYMEYDKPDEEEHPDTWEFLGQQIKGLIVLGLWMIVGSVVAK